VQASSASSLARIIANVGPRLAAYRQAFSEQNTLNVRVILAFVRNDTLSERYASEIIRKYRDASYEGVAIKVYSYEELLHKYGFTPNSSKTIVSGPTT
jgi:hypothetical protein